MFDRITHGRKLKSQRYAKKGENQKAIVKLSAFAYSVSGHKKAEIRASAPISALYK